MDQKVPREAKDRPGQNSIDAESQTSSSSPGRVGSGAHPANAPGASSPLGLWKEICLRLHSEDKHFKKELVTWNDHAQL